jgi:hypothetical protein
MRARSRHGMRAVLALAAVAGMGATFSAESIPEPLLACTRIPRDEDRLACLDRQIARITGHAPARASPPSRAARSEAPSTRPPAAASAPALTPEQRFGLSTDQLRRLEARKGISPAHIDEITARIARLSRDASNDWIFMLDNGQVWRQAESKSSFEIAPGNAVTIRRGALGSFRLETDKHNWTRVERVL